MTTTDDRFRERIRLMIDSEIAELERMRIAFAEKEQAPLRAMANVCGWAKERFELLRERVRLLEHEVRR